MSNWRIVKPFALVAVAVCFLCQSAFAENDRKFKIGCILPLTGALAEYGAAARNGFELAKKEHGSLFGRIEFLYDDSQYDSKKTVSAYRNFKNIGDVSLVYVWGYGPNQALIPIAETEKSPLIAVTAERTAVTNRKYSLRFAYDGAMIADALIKYLRSRNLKKLVLVKTELAFINGILDGMRERLQQEETIDVVDNYEGGDFDFRSSIAKLRRMKFDALGVFLISGQVSQFYRQSREMGLTATTFGTDFLDSIKEVHDAGGAMEGAVFATGLVDSGFVERYRKQYGNDLQLTWAANGYEFAMLVAAVFGQTAERLSAEEVIARLRNARVESGGAAEYRFHDSDGSAGFDSKVGMRKVLQGSIVEVQS